MSAKQRGAAVGAEQIGLHSGRGPDHAVALDLKGAEAKNGWAKLHNSPEGKPMKNSSATRAGVKKAVRAWTAASLLALFLWPPATSAATEATTAPAPPASGTPAPASAARPAMAQPTETERRASWQREIAKVPLPKKGCFNATFPEKVWREVPCGPPSKFPNQPGTPPTPNNVGYGNSVAARSAGLISSAVGSFDSVTPATVTASGPVRGNPATPAPDAFSLQLNSQAFDTPACNGVAGCKGWQQFIYSRYQCAPLACVFTEYWLLNYGPTCPSPFLSAGSGGHCYRNGPTAAAPALTAAQLQGPTLTGLAAGGPGGDDQVVLTTAGAAATATSPNLLGLNQHWNTVEWNVVGDCCGSRVDFSAGTSIVPRVILNGSSRLAPTCAVPNPATAESNNLNFGPNAPAASGVGPALMYMESDPGGGLPSNCAAASSIGDTHLATFNGLLYDFQASGDFVLVSGDPDFVVQARQVSGAPNWPNASVNSAVAARMGKTQVAICLGATRLHVDGKATELSDGKTLALPEGVVVTRRGNAYVIRSQSGDSVRAEVNSTWINVAVGLGRWPAKVSGLLANAEGDVNKIAARDGAVLTNPFPFEDLYRRYADSWRIEPRESLMSVCGDKEVERGIPRKPFYANDLEPKVRDRARAVCTAAGVKAAALLDACTLDVAVIGDEAAARVFVGLPDPVSVARAVAITSADGGEWRTLRWLPWLLALIAFALVAWLILARRKMR